MRLRGTPLGAPFDSRDCSIRSQSRGGQPERQLNRDQHDRVERRREWITAGGNLSQDPFEKAKSEDQYEEGCNRQNHGQDQRSLRSSTAMVSLEEAVL